MLNLTRSSSLDRFRRMTSLCAAVACIAASSARAVILLSTGDPEANTSAPSGGLVNSGWQHQGTWGAFLGTPIAPHFFISAKHVGNAGLMPGGLISQFTFQGVNYTVTAGFGDPAGDFAIWQVQETFPYYAPLYTKQDEAGKALVVIGRGTPRGPEKFADGMLRGWGWGGGDSRQRWGENVVSQIAAFATGPNDALYATFDQNALPNEAHLSVGDSGGAVFLNDAGTWKLAGINYAVDGHFYLDSSGTNPFDAALFDMRGFYISDEEDPPTYFQVMGAMAVPSGFYSTRISSKLAWIYSVIEPGGDANGNGISNLLDYALVLNSPPAPGYGATPISVADGLVSLIYRKISTAAQLQYAVEKSTDLTSWTAANPTEQVIGTSENVQTIKASVPQPAGPLFLRLKITEAVMPSAGSYACHPERNSLPAVAGRISN